MSKVLAQITTTAILKPHAVVVTSKYSARKTTDKQKQNLLNFSDRDGIYNGYLSENTTRNIRKMLDNWLVPLSERVDLKQVPSEMDSNKIYPTFVTLTLPSKQIHSDKFLKKECLDTFNEWLRTACGVNCYFWRAESQKNGNLHFHIIIDKFVYWDRIRHKWNKIIEKFGYITRYSNYQKFIHRNGYVQNNSAVKQEIERITKTVQKFEETNKLPRKGNARVIELCAESQRLNRKISKAQIKEVAESIQLDRYYSAQFDDFKNPNTTDIHSINNIQSLSSYVVKYCTKSPLKPLEDNQIIEEKEGKKYIITTVNENGYTYTITDEFKPVFESRKVRGHLWGASDSLRMKDEDEKPVLCYPSIHLIEEERVHDSSPKAIQEFYTRTVDVNETGINFIDSLTIDKRTVNDYCTVYASKKPVKEFLEGEIKQIYSNHYQAIWLKLYAIKT